MARKVKVMTGPPREPKQERSQRSLERVLEAATELLTEEGYEGLSLKKVSARSGVSTGSIYARIDSKDDLIHILAGRLYRDRRADHDRMMEKAREIADLRKLIAFVIPRHSEILRHYAPVLRPILLRAPFDPVLLESGKTLMLELRHEISDLIAEHRDEIVHPRPDHAARVAFAVASDTVFFTLGLGTLLEAPEMVRWDEQMEDLVDAVTRLLCARLDGD